MHRVYFYRDDFYKYCSKIFPSGDIQNTNLFPISRKVSPNPTMIELVLHPRTNDSRITRLLHHLCNNRYLLPKLFVHIIN